MNVDNYLLNPVCVKLSVEHFVPCYYMFYLYPRTNLNCEIERLRKISETETERGWYVMHYRLHASKASGLPVPEVHFFSWFKSNTVFTEMIVLIRLAH